MSEGWEGILRRDLETLRRTAADFYIVRDVLAALVKAVDEQNDIDPSISLVQAMKDAKSWVPSETTK